MSADLVPVDNMAAVEALDPQARELAVTHMLAEARAWLAHAVETTSPQTIANFKAQMATMAEASKQLNLSKEIQTDALAMVRRGEGALANAIRKGQEERVIRKIGDGGGTGVKGSRGSRDSYKEPVVSPFDFGTNTELYGNGTGIMALADVTPAELESAIEEAKEEGNLSRANVVRKVRGEGSHETRDERARLISELAAKGHSTRQIAPLVGVSEQSVFDIARAYGIEIPADAMTKNTRRIRSAEVVDNVIGTLEAATFSLAHVNPSEVRGEQIDSLIQSINALRKAINKIKESIA